MFSLVNFAKTALFGLAAALSLGAAPAVHAQTVTNVASMQWQVGPSTVVQQSNQISFAIVPPPPAPPSLKTFQLAGQGMGQAHNLGGSQCIGPNGPAPVALNGVFEGTPLSPASVKPASAIRAGEPLIVALTSVEDNRDAAAVETLNVTIRTPAGDAERLILTESSANSGVFVGIVNTSPNPAAPIQGDCVLTVKPGDTINLNGIRTSDNTNLASAPVDILIDPFGIVFDSGDGAPVAGTRVTLINADTGQPAQVFGDDGISSFPSTIVTGSTVTDSGGTTYAFPPGDYRFPFARPGRYRLQVQPPAPYTVPSRSTPAELASLRRPDGQPFTVTTGSYSDIFALNDPAPVRIDIPADRPGGVLILSKTASIPVAAPGDPLQYRIQVRNSDGARSTGAITITDLIPREMRLKANTVRINGGRMSYSVTSDGRTLTIPVPALRGGGSATITYILEVRPDAKPGYSMNSATARDNRGAASSVAEAMVRIARDGITDRMTIIGRITDGGCTIDPDAANGVPGVRVMLEDGSYAVTDIEGRYHFEGVAPGLHVVQIDPSSLPADQVPADCVRNARSGGSAISRFVEGQGGSLARADFRTATGHNEARQSSAAAVRPAPASDAEAAGAERDWFANGDTSIAWLFPEADHNPRTKAVRVAIRHLPGQDVTLYADGKRVDDVAFEGARKSGDERFAVSLWRGVAIGEENTELKAEVRDADGRIVETLTRAVHFANIPMRAELLRDKSVLVADGVTRPVLAIRMIDRSGKPVRKGLTGDFELSAPYFPAVEAEAQAARGLAGLERSKPVWRVEGDDGVAYVELEPTTASGTLSITLPFRDRDVSRKQRLETWLTPGERPWTVVGFAAGTVGFNALKGRLENLDQAANRWLTDGRIALYAKGRVKGKWLMTLSYDSDKDRADSRFGGVIDPQAYYTIYADRSERRYDAASLRKLYLKLERPQFYALFGDYDTGINEPILTRYSRAFNGVKAEFRNEQVSVSAFAADTPFRHRREEIQGNGLSGPYALAARDILPNSERVVLETRDRLRSDRIVETRALVRHVDYDIDYVQGTLRFREPILSRSSGLDPQFIVVDYEVDGVAQRVTNAGGRATWTSKDKTLTLGATAVHDEDDRATTTMSGVDLRYRPDAETEIRAEFALSNADARQGQTVAEEGNATAWLVEAEHHSGKFDVLAYAREQQRGFGVGQTNFGESGARKIGIDTRLRIDDALSFTGSAWQEEYLASIARRQAGRGLVEYKTQSLALRAGITAANDRLEDGRTLNSVLGTFGATKRFFANRLELDAQTELPLQTNTDSIDFPARHRLSARYAVNEDITLTGTYEIADGDTIDARTARVGFDLKPWTGARFVASANRQDTNEYGPRSFAAYGLSQSLPVSEKVTVDFTLEGNKTLGGFDPRNVLNPAHPVASGGYIGTDGVLSEDFTAVTAGLTYRGKDWSIAGRAEARSGSLGDRYGLNVSALRQIGEGRAFGGALSWFKADQDGGVSTVAKSLAMSWAHRPDDSPVAILNKLELRQDKVKGAVAGLPGPIGGAALTVEGNASSTRLINSFAFNLTPNKRTGNEFLQRSEIGFFWGSRYVSDKYGADDIKGWSNVFGADLRYDIGAHVDLGLAGTIRQNPGGRSYAFSGGPQIGVSPAENTYITLGYNVVGFRDRDFEDSRYTRNGPYLTLRLKFDQQSLAGLGLLGRR